MCLLFIYFNSNPLNSKFRLIVASNRDEFFARPTSHAASTGDDPKIICGEDQMKGREGGTWLGVSSNGKFASILNQSDGAPTLQEGESRGFLVKDYLKNNLSASDYIHQIDTSGIKYAKFSLILLNYLQPEACYYDNIDNQCTPLVDGIHGFSNSVLNSPYQKVTYGKCEFEKIVHRLNDKSTIADLEIALFDLMQDRTKHFPDEVLLAKKSVPPHILPELSSKFVYIPEVGYGTRTMTVILIDKDGHVSFTEKTGTGNYSDANTNDWLHSKCNLSAN